MLIDTAREGHTQVGAHGRLLDFQFYDYDGVDDDDNNDDNSDNGDGGGEWDGDDDDSARLMPCPKCCFPKYHPRLSRPLQALLDLFPPRHRQHDGIKGDDEHKELHAKLYLFPNSLLYICIWRPF